MAASRVEAAGAMLLPDAVESIAEQNGDLLYARYARSRDLADGFEDLSFEHFNNAINATAHFLQQKLGRRDTSEVVAYLGPNGPVTAVSFIACNKAGFDVFMTSERNSVSTQLHLFAELECDILLTNDASYAPVKAIIDTGKVGTVLELPPLHDLVRAGQPDFRFGKTLGRDGDDTCFITHTSGSTGFPKAVRLSFESVARMSRNIALENPDGYETLNAMIGGNCGISFLPLSHPAGVNMGILNAVYNKATVVLPPPGIPPTAQMLDAMLEYVDVDWAVMAPLTLESLSKDAQLAERVCKKLSMLIFSGGTLPKVFGDMISSKVRLLSSIGSSETGPLPTMYRRGFDWVNDWNYLEFHPMVRADFVPMLGSVSELVIRKTLDSLPYQPIFLLNDNLREYRTKDLFIEHPSRDGLWTYTSRADDVIVLLNGEKVNPVDFESIVTAHPTVSGALMFGKQQFETGLLVELEGNAGMTARERSVALDELWPTVEKANALLPSYAHVTRSHVLFTVPDEPLQRTEKGNIRRQATLDRYETAITKLYADIEEMWVVDATTAVSSDAAEVAEAVHLALQSNDRLAALAPDDDFFDAGMSSLEALRLVRELRQFTGIHALDPSTVYQASTTARLTKAVLATAQQNIANEQRRLRERRAAVLDLRRDLSSIDFSTYQTSAVSARVPAPAPSDRRTVLLTGSTGSIGRYLLRALMEHPSVARIYCLNRSADSGAEQARRNAAAGDATLPTTFDHHKVVFLTADLADSHTLGLDETRYEALCEEVTDVIHAAWPVDFNLPLDAFVPVLHGLNNLLRLCAHSANHAKFLFISSQSTTMGQTGCIPESLSPDPASCPAVGYSESKWIGEWLVEQASRSPVFSSCGVVRLGQVAGAVRSAGPWNTADWVPALVLSSAYLRAIPDHLDAAPGSGSRRDIQWLPIDTVADVLTDLCFAPADAEQPFTVYHPLNPHRVSWADLLPSIRDALKADANSPAHGADVEVVSPDTWLRRLRRSAADGDPEAQEEGFERLLELNPALKLQAHFETRYGKAPEETGSISAVERSWESRNAETASSALRDAKAVGEHDVRRWIAQWLPERKPVSFAIVA